ncbi:MAG: hypothetical protein GWN47_05330 [Woeseiaceae bacterium]|nr:hypothetical protein [Woeseiaceae bacterium]
MARKVFRSKVDRWVWLVMLTANLGALAAITAVVFTDGRSFERVIVIFACLLAMAVFAAVIFGTSYAVDRGVLTIRCGPFRWKVKLDEIRSVKATRNPLSSPALSLDRIRIFHGEGRSVMISPADKKGFLKAIGRELEE